MNLLIRIVRPSRCFIPRSYSTSSDGHSKLPHNVEPSELLSDEEIEFEVEEVRISVPYGGHLAAKWWGDKSIKPFLMLHGWQDNAGTFDRLIPLLPKQYSYLAIDLPGHGLSSQVPNSMQYHTMDKLLTLNHLLKEYNWDKVSLIGHSLGSIISFMFTSVFPKKVDFLVGIDALKPSVLDSSKVAMVLGERIEDFMIADSRNQEKSEPPAYKIEEMVEKMVKATRGSVTKEAACFLLKRNIRQSEKHPGKYYFTRDNRLKYNLFPGFSQELSIELAKRINCPYLFIKAKNSPYYERKEYHNEVAEVLKNNKNFEYHTIDSTHHLHLTEPEKISGLISDFILKHKKVPNSD